MYTHLYPNGKSFSHHFFLALYTAAAASYYAIINKKFIFEKKKNYKFKIVKKAFPFNCVTVVSKKKFIYSPTKQFDDVAIVKFMVNIEHLERK